jgi:hypothetical protein
VWTRTVNGEALHFYLAGINNQNFLMRDKETGTWWQQINGKAIYGPLKGASLDLVPYDELTFGEWKSEVSGGQVFAPITKYKKEYDPNWEPDIAKLPVVISFPGAELKSRDVVVGVEVDGASRCYPWDTLVKQSPIMDHAGGKPVLIAVAPDGKSFRAFVSRVDGKDAEFFLKGADAAAPSSADTKPSTASAPPLSAKSSKAPANGSAGGPPAVAAATSLTSGQQTQPSATAATASAGSAKPADPAPKPWVLVDTTTASQWNFQGCAISGPAQGKCLERIPILKDYWFDWRNYHPDTTIYKR